MQNLKQNQPQDNFELAKKFCLLEGADGCVVVVIADDGAAVVTFVVVVVVVVQLLMKGELMNKLNVLLH